jgi:hypothetical protein
MPGLRDEHALRRPRRPQQRRPIALTRTSPSWRRLRPRLATGRPFHDGNKRIAFVTTVFSANGVELGADGQRPVMLDCWRDDGRHHPTW